MSGIKISQKMKIELGSVIFTTTRMNESASTIFIIIKKKKRTTLLIINININCCVLANKIVPCDVIIND